MKKRIITIALIVLMGFAFLPGQSHAAVTPYFVIINETLLPFSAETMPLRAGSDYFVPVGVFTGLGVWAVGSDDLDRVRVYRENRYVDFFTVAGEERTENQDGVVLRWPHARRVGRIFYVPLRQICDFFGLSYQVVEVGSDIISERQMYVIRIISTSQVNGPSAVGMNRNAIRTAYANYFAPPPTPPTDQPPGTIVTQPQPPVVELPLDFSDVTMHLSFNNVSAGGADWILDLLDIQTASGFHACFFVGMEDIFEDPGLVRRISGTGHTIGIWLSEGTFEEYTRISQLLFEAAKVTTVIISADEASDIAAQTAYEHGLIFWESGQSLVDYSEQSVATITADIPRESGTRGNLLFSCSEEAAALLPGVYAFLRSGQFTVERISETTPPIAEN